MQETFRKWGLGAKEGIDLPGEATGRVPDAQWKASYYANSSEDDRAWKGGDYTNLAIGQGDLLVTPLQMCCVYAGISTKGTIWKPHLLKSVDAAVGSGSVIDHKDALTYQVEERPAYLDLVHAGLKGVIYEESGADVPLRHASRDGGRQDRLSPDAQEPARRLVHRLCALR